MLVFAARAALDANREVVEVLRLVGAKNSFIARQISQRFLMTGLVAGCAGIVFAGITFLSLGSSGQASGNGVAAASFSLLFAPHDDLLSTLLLILAVPVVATLIALVTANITLTHMLRAAP